MNGIKKFGLATLLLAPMVATQALNFGGGVGVNCTTLQLGKTDGAGNDAVFANLPAVAAHLCSPAGGLSIGIGTNFEAIVIFTNHSNDTVTLPNADMAGYPITLKPENTISGSLNYLITPALSVGVVGNFSKLGIKKNNLATAEEYTNSYGVAFIFSQSLFSRMNLTVDASYARGEIDSKPNTAFTNNTHIDNYRVGVYLGYNSSDTGYIAAATDEDEESSVGLITRW